MLKTHVTKVLNAVLATTTSNKVYVGDAKRIGFLFRRGSHSSGSTAFSVNIGGEDENTVTPTMTATNMLIKDIVADAGTGTAGEDIGHTRVASVSLGANADVMAWLDSKVLCTYVSVTATETTDGAHTAFLLVQKED